MSGTSLIATMAAKQNMDPAQFARTIRSTVMPSEHTEEQFAAFMMVAHQHGLNPILREIYAYPARGKGGGITPVVSIDGWINLVNSHPQSDGFDITYTEDDAGKLLSATCKMWRKDRSHPVVVTESYAECYRNTDPWNQMPRRMLRHKAFKECARLAYGFAGLHDEDEARDISRAVDRIEKPIASPQTRIIDSLDTFAAETQDRAVGPVSVAVDAEPEETPHDGVVAMGETVDQETGEVVTDVWTDAVQRIMTMATDKQVDQQGRLENLDQMRPIYLDALPAEKAKALFETARKVVEGELPVASAKRYLESIQER